MPKAVQLLAAAVIASAVSVMPLGTPTAAAAISSCSGGDFRWTAVDGAITMQPTLLTFTSVGRLWDCTGPANISGGTFTGVHIAWSDCMHPADGPLTVNITWDNGEVSTLWGPWPVGMSQPTIGPMEVIDGYGKGSHVRVVATYEMLEPDMVMGCVNGTGVKTGPGRLSATLL
ncbi:hypothetical protein OHB26_36325 [Nocardia sp. NBC_01503]|uniref:hypothetical protein n=1 Tax=Nocardia sp. NBC_01503 TaxID=2975997 RepID=UPI002E7C19CC|nr:hypothetical protein [Nocardia sp. NBC_01503]WTL32277.1 hypothetical protein OHB26_36325 [Nocardia sp. NBC_01503]